MHYLIKLSFATLYVVTVCIAKKETIVSQTERVI